MHPVLLFPRLVLLQTLIALIGWAFHLPILTSVVPQFSTMKPNTALALGLLAICCRARTHRNQDGQGRLGKAGSCVLASAFILSGGSLLEYLSGKNLGLDSLIFRVPLDRFGDPPGRMSPATALCLLLIVFALALLDRAPRLSVWILLTVNLIAIAVLTGFVANTGPLMNVHWLRSLSVPTTLCLMMLVVATLASRPERQPVSTLLRSTAYTGRGGRLLFTVIVLPLLVGLPVAVAIRRSLPEAVVTFVATAVLLYSAETWFSEMQGAGTLDEAKTASAP